MRQPKILVFNNCGNVGYYNYIPGILFTLFAPMSEGDYMYHCRLRLYSWLNTSVHIKMEEITTHSFPEEYRVNGVKQVINLGEKKIKYEGRPDDSISYDRLIFVEDMLNTDIIHDTSSLDIV